GSPPAARLRHVLLADDDPTQCKLARLLLRREGFRVTMAHTGAEAMWHLRADRPDVVLSDVRMPEMDGLALCQFVKGDPATAAIPVVLVTSYEVEAADRERALQ